MRTDNLKGGQLAGEFLVKLLNEKGNVIFLQACSGFGEHGVVFL